MVHSFPTRRSSDLAMARHTPRRAGPQAGRRPPRSEEHTSELQSHHPISYAVFCLKKKKKRAKRSHDIDKAGNVAVRFHCGSFSWLPSLMPKSFFFFNDTATTEIYTGWYTLSLHDALPI